jgi:hypothetical protein
MKPEVEHDYHGSYTEVDKVDEMIDRMEYRGWITDGECMDLIPDAWFMNPDHTTDYECILQIRRVLAIHEKSSEEPFTFKELRWRKRMPSATELESLPLIESAHTCDLHCDIGDARLWLARTSIEDGEPFKSTVYVELKQDGRWIDAGYYDGDYPPEDGMGWSYKMFVDALGD